MKRLPSAILLSSTVYVFFFSDKTGIFPLIIKAIPMLLIYSYANLRYLTSKHPAQRFLLFGLLFGLLGDILIGIKFEAGLVAFLIGHLFYIKSFGKQWLYSPIRAVLSIPLLCLAYSLGAEIIPAISERGLTNLYIPVSLYILVISLMSWFAIMTGQKWAMLGSFCFLVSDALLAWNHFITDIGGFRLFIMMTYYSAQFLIAKSIYTDEKEFSLQTILSK